MKTKKFRLLAFGLAAAVLAGCFQKAAGEITGGIHAASEKESAENEAEEEIMDWSENMIKLEDGLSAVLYRGDHSFDEFLAQGGASSDGEVVRFLTERVILGAADLSINTESFGCSTISAPSGGGHFLFGRNFDWNTCEALIMGSRPENGYASISTVNTDFIRQGTRRISGLALRNEQILTQASLYAPLDGMNEKGLAVYAGMRKPVYMEFWAD